jgi:hypothetical protein
MKLMAKEQCVEAEDCLAVVGLRAWRLMRWIESVVVATLMIGGLIRVE